MANRPLKVGMVLYRYYDGMDELHITSIKRPNIKRGYGFKTEYPIRVYAVVKHEFTWVKVSRKNFDYGWAKNIDPCWKVDFSLDEYNEKGLPSPLSFTKEGAFTKAIEREQFWLNRVEKNDQEGIDEYKKAIAKIKQQQSAFKNKKRKKKGELDGDRGRDTNQGEGNRL